MVSFLAKSDWPRTNLPVVIGDPSVPSGNIVSTWGVPVVDAPVPLTQYTVPQDVDPLHVWRSQPSVRKVVDFIARQCASVPWHAYLRVSDTDRQRAKRSNAEVALSQPGRFQTGYSMWHKVVVDMCLYDAWCVALLDGKLTRISPRQLQLKTDVFGEIEQILIATAGTNAYQGMFVDITDYPIAITTGWSGAGGGGISPLTTLRAIMRENQHAVEWRDAVWLNGPKSSGYLTRPAGATWDEPKRERFVQSWRTFRTSNAGGTPLLEDGMDYKPLDNVKPSDAQDIQGRQLTDVEVSSAFHIPPELVGARAGNFSNIAAFRQMLFGPALGPRLEELQQAVNAELVPALDATPDLYVELDRESAMNGSFMEQAAVMSTAIGGPWLTRNEGRAKQNLPAVDGGDRLVTPMNVTVGGQASPRDSGSQNVNPAADPNAETATPKASTERFVAKAAPSAAAQRTLQETIAALYRQQTAEVEQGVKVDPEEFHKQWDAVAAEAVQSHLFGAAAEGAQRSLAALNAPQEAWSADVMRNYIAAMSDTVGGGVTKTVIDRINADEWPVDPEQPEQGPSKAGLVASLETVAATWAVSALVDAAGFGAHDGAHAAGANSKTWETGDHPRPEHAAINGETVPFDDTFSIGVRWPGDSMGDADQTVNCNCGVSFTVG